MNERQVGEGGGGVEDTHEGRWRSFAKVEIKKLNIKKLDVTLLRSTKSWYEL